MHEGRAQFMVCHHHPASASRLDARSFSSLPQGDDMLIPVKAPDAPFDPLGENGARLPYLSYSQESGLGRIVGAVRAKQQDRAPNLEPVFTAHLATALRAMAVAGRGIAWLPLTLIQADLGSRRLVRAGGQEWDIGVEIRAYRPRHRLSPAAEAFWSGLK